MLNSSKVDTILQLNHEAVIQDRSSQQTGELVKGLSITDIWIVAAASGGKSIMIHDLIKKLILRFPMFARPLLIILKKDFPWRGSIGYKSFVADLTDKNDNLPNDKYDLIIADVHL